MRLTLLTFILLLGACASINNEPQTPASSAAISELTSYARTLIGTPYKYGGNSPDSGFDCSGFVGHVFRHALGVNLPRNADEMSRFGRSVSTDDLRAGDLVFFNTQQSRFSHVGIYLGDNRFIHAPSSGGKVRTENILNSYWKNHYDGARRITLRG